MPTLSACLGRKGRRPQVGTRDGRGTVYVFASANVVTGKLTARRAATTQWGRRKAHLKHGLSRQGAMQRLFARHIDDVARDYPPRAHPRVELIIDNAPWHAGGPIRDALARHPHLHLVRLPSYCPQLQPIEWLWRPMRRATTHNTLYEELAHLSAALGRTLRSLRRRPSAVLQSLGDCWHPPGSPSS